MKGNYIQVSNLMEALWWAIRYGEEHGRGQSAFVAGLKENLEALKAGDSFAIMPDMSGSRRSATCGD